MKLKLIPRFLRFSTFGILSFCIDFVLLTIFVESLNTDYIRAAGIAFLCGSTFQYLATRHFSFKDTKRPIQVGYAYFITISIFNLIITLWLLNYFVNLTGWNYLIVRVIVAGIVGIWNFIINAKVTFRTALFGND